MKNDASWLIEDNSFRPAKELYHNTVFTLANGYMACRGTLEEGRATKNVRSYFGTYVSGIFDTYAKRYQAIVNLPDFMETEVSVGGETMSLTSGRVSGYARVLDMKTGTLTRRFTWTSPKGRRTSFEFTRFVSRDDLHVAALRIRVTPLGHSSEVVVTSRLDAKVTNIDFHVSGYQLRDEKYFFVDEEVDAARLPRGGVMVVRTKGTRHEVCEAFHCAVSSGGRPVGALSRTAIGERALDHTLRFRAAAGRACDFVKTVAVYTSNDGVKSLKSAAWAKVKSAESRGFEELLAAHERAWSENWETADVRIEGAPGDDKAVRFNLFHVIQMGHPSNPRVNIGSRGLTSEMHYGNCFWDTELFIMPFFIYTDPKVARNLAEYRHLTLPAAREKAEKLWFKGAMFPWMSSWPGHEQADYWEYANIAVHIVSDVAFGLMHYVNASGDRAFLERCGLEILAETARFWASRVDWSDVRKGYVLNVVKGPNEYVIANNNTYTNWNARWNLETAAGEIDRARRENPRAYAVLAKKLKLEKGETAAWRRIAKKIVINHDRKKDLFIEDDGFLDRRPADLARFKPGKKISTEMGWTWDTFLRHRIVKQADVLLLMTLHHGEFTERQLRAAWKFYEPLTSHDSSLSYNTHAIVANELGEEKKAYDYFQQTVRLDLDDVMENVFLGIHSANAGGAWQCVVNGFCGMRLEGDSLVFRPCLPKHWKSVSFRVLFRGRRFLVRASGMTVAITQEDGAVSGIEVADQRITCREGRERR